MPFIINGSKFHETTRSDAFFGFYNEQRFCDVILVIKEDEVANLDMRQPFYEAPPQYFHVSSVSSTDSQSDGFSTVAERRLNGQRGLSSAGGASIPSVASLAGTQFVSTDDLWSYRDNNRSFAESTLESGTNLNLSANNTIDQNQNVPSLGASTGSFSILSDSTECDYQWRKLCHKVILAKNSPLLDEFLENATKILEVINPTDQSFEEAPFTAAMTQVEGRKIMQVEVKDVDVSSMESILTFIYTGELIFEFEDFATLWQDAEKLQVFPLVDLCQDFLSKPLDASNCVSVLLLNYYRDNEEAIDICLRFLAGNISHVREKQNEEVIRCLPLDIMERFMNSDEIVEINAEDAFEILIIWAEGGHTGETAALHNLMKSKIKLLSFDFLLANLSNPEKVQLDHASSILVHSTMMAKKPVSTFSPPETSWVSPVPLSSDEAQSSREEQSSPLTSLEEKDETSEETLLALTASWASGHWTPEVPQIFDTESNTWIEWTMECLGNVFNAIVVGKFVVTLGGLKDGKLYRNAKLYNLETQKIITGPNMLIPRRGFGRCVVNGDTVIVCGGCTAQYEGFEECEFLKLNSDGTGQWERLPPMPTGRLGCSAASIGNRNRYRLLMFTVFIIGGQSGFNTTATVHSTVEEFDVTSKKWTTRSSMNEARSAFAIATHQNMIYVFGGWREMTILNSCERYDPLIDKWTYICCLPSPRYRCVSGLLKNEIFVIGGIDSDDEILKAVEVYDPREDKFQRGPYLNSKVISSSCVAVKKRWVFN